MNRKSLFTIMMLTACGALNSVHADITVDGSGYISPSSTPSSWTSSTDVTIGLGGSATLSINNNGGNQAINARTVYIGGNATTTGTGTVNLSGEGTRWTTNGTTNPFGNLYVGYSGTGTLNVSNGADVTFSNLLYVGYSAGSSGSIVLDGPGTILTGTRQGSWIIGGGLLNNASSGTLSIINGATATNAGNLTLANAAGSTGTLIIDGNGSSMSTTMVTKFSVNATSNANVRITNGGSYSGSNQVIIGNTSATTGKTTALVDGHNSSLASSTTQTINNNATLYVLDGAKVSAGTTFTVNSIGSGSGTLIMDIGNGSSATAGGAYTNNGTVKFLASASLSANAEGYSPISAGSWASGNGSYLVYGGTWNDADHKVFVTSVATANAGTSVQLVRDTTQLNYQLRASFTDATSNKSAGLSFQADTDTIHVTAETISAELLAALDTTSGVTDALAGWSFSATEAENGAAVNDAYLSIQIGGGYNINDLAVYIYNEGDWSALDIPGLGYDGDYVNFLAESVGTGTIYAVATIPEPGTASLLGLAAAGVLLKRRKKYCDKE